VPRFAIFVGVSQMAVVLFGQLVEQDRRTYKFGWLFDRFYLLFFFFRLNYQGITAPFASTFIVKQFKTDSQQ
jgi:hypothetical protein